MKRFGSAQQPHQQPKIGDVDVAVKEMKMKRFGPAQLKPYKTRNLNQTTRDRKTTQPTLIEIIRSAHAGLKPTKNDVSKPIMDNKPNRQQPNQETDNKMQTNPES